MANTYEEVLRFLIQAKGDEDVARLAREILELEEAGEGAQEKVAALLDEFGKSRGLQKTADQFRDVGQQVLQLGQKYNATRDRIGEVAEELSKTEAPTKRQLREFDNLEQQLNRTGAELDRAKGQWSLLRGVLESSGVAAKRYSDIQASIAAKQQQSTAALRAFATEQLQVRDASAATAARLEEQDRAFRDQVRTSRGAADALAAYRARAAAAAEDTRDLGSAANATSGIFDRLKGLAAAALGFFSFRSLGAGIKSIITEGSNAEQELAQLEAVLVSTGRSAEFTAEQLVALADKAAKSSSFAAGDILNLQTRLLSYTNIVGEQYPAAMQAAIDQAARLGISLEQSAEIIGRSLQEPEKAMQALGRQGFYLEESQKALVKQLVATGRTAEAQAVILDLLTESYGGAAAAQKVGTIAGLWKAATERIRDFQQLISDRGVLDYFKDQLNELLAVGDRLARDGTLARWAKQASDAIVGAARAVRAGTTFLYEHAGALVFLGKAYAALKIGGALVALNAWRIGLVAATQAAITKAGALDTTASAATRLGRVLRALPGAIQIGVALIGVDLAVKGARSLGEWLGKHSDAAKEATAASERMREQLRREAQQYAESAAVVARYRDVTVLTADQVSRLSEAERKAYEDRLAGLRIYLQEQLGYLLRQKEIGAATEEQLDQLAQIPARLAAVRAGYAAIGEGARIAAAAIDSALTPAAIRVMGQLEGIERDAKLAASSIKGLFDGLNFVDSNSLGDVALALAQVSTLSAGANRNVRDGLQATLRQMTGEDLQRFQGAAAAAFDVLKRGPADTAAILDTTLKVALEKLGVSAERMGFQFTDAGRDATAAFGVIVENANASSAQIEVAFRAALSRVATLDEARALGALLEQAGRQGAIGFAATERSAGALRARIRDIQASLSPLTNDFERLGITSKASLDAARDAARASFEAIRAGAARGEAAIEDVRAAFQRYSEASRAAVVNSDASTRSRVEGELRVQEAIHGVNRGLQEMEKHGSSAGQAVAAGAREAAAALDSAGDAGASAAKGVEQTGKSTSDATKFMGDASKQGQNFALALYEVSDAAMKAYMQTNRLAGQSDLWRRELNGITDAVNAQGDALREQLKELDKASGAYDELAARRDQLQKKFDLLGAGEIEKLVQAEQRLDQQRKSAAATKEREVAAARAARAEADRAARDATSASSADQTLTIRWLAPSKSVATAASAAEIEQAERIADLVAPRVLQRLERAKSMSSTRLRR